jgi:DeoR family fructose operon transcriptional repressor
MVNSSLDAEIRREQLHALLQRDGAVVLAEVAGAYGVSEMTIRRDLFDLERAGVARRVRGGAVAVGPELFQRRQQRAAGAKQAISAKLMALVPTGGAIALDASSTIHRFAVDLSAGDLTVVTSGLETFAALRGRTGVRSYLTGGEIEEATGSLVGAVAQRTIRDFVFARAFVSATCLDARFGATEATFDGGELKRTMRSCSSSVVLAIDSSKLGESAPAKALDLDEIDIVVTELDPQDERLDPFRDRVELL